jgi:carbamoylphosphate synthase large subunit
MRKRVVRLLATPRYWLRASGFPHPRMRVFCDLAEVLAFCADTDLPIVYKPYLGATATGVRIFRSRAAG